MSRQRRISRGKKINPTFFVFCEGETEESYINMLKTEYRIASIIIHPKIGKNDITEKYIQGYKRGKPTHSKDKTFLMYDLDVPTMFQRLSKITGGILLVSNPTIEVWFLLHYKNITSECDSRYCFKELGNRNKQYKKGYIDTKLKEKLLEKRKEAINRAKKLESFKNPSSTVYIFIEILESLRNH